jgi:hypothetical protein
MADIEKGLETRPTWLVTQESDELGFAYRLQRPAKSIWHSDRP